MGNRKNKTKKAKSKVASRIKWDHRWCSQCKGNKFYPKITAQKIVPHPDQSILNAIAPWPESRNALNLRRLMEELSEQLQFDINTSWENLEKSIHSTILFGAKNRKFHLSPFYIWSERPKKEVCTFEGLIKIYQEKSVTRQAYGIKSKCDALRPLRPWERIQLIVEEHQKDNIIPFLLTDFSATLRFTQHLTDKGGRFRAVPELLSVDEDSYLDPEYARYRRWVIFIHQDDIEIAHRLIEQSRKVVKEHDQPVQYITGSLCRKGGHEFELSPCSWCDTGYDWIAKADLLMEAHTPTIPKNTL